MTPKITIRSIILPLLSILTGIIFLSVDRYMMSSEFLIAAASLALITGCSVLSVHPMIGQDSQMRKIFESALGIVSVLGVREATIFFQVSAWDSTQVDYMTAILFMVSLGSLFRSLLEDIEG